MHLSSPLLEAELVSGVGIQAVETTRYIPTAWIHQDISKVYLGKASEVGIYGCFHKRRGNLAMNIQRCIQGGNLEGTEVATWIHPTH